MRRLRHRADLNVAVNVSARQFSEADFVPRLSEMIASLPRGILTLEITESLLIEEPERVSGVLTPARRPRCAPRARRLRHRLLEPLESQRVADSPAEDRPQLRLAARGEGPESDTLVSGIVHLGEGLGLEVIAEGVETAQQAEQLLELGCHLAQGYFFGRPQQWNRKTFTEQPLTERPILRLVEPRTA